MDKLTEIVASDHLNVPKEETVFEATMSWLNKCASRKQSFEKVSSREYRLLPQQETTITLRFLSFRLFLLKVLEHIRLPLISPYYLHDVIESLDVVKENQACQKLISEAKDYLLLKDRRAELYCPRARPRRSTGEHIHMHYGQRLRQCQCVHFVILNLCI